jgi:predicted phosphodiesterase
MGRDIEDFAIIAGLAVVGYIAYEQFFPKKSLEEVIAELDKSFQSIIGSIKLPSLPPIPMPVAPPVPMQQAAAAASSSSTIPEASPNIPITPTEPAAQPINTISEQNEPDVKEPPKEKKPKGSGQLPTNPKVSAPPPSSGGAIVAFAGDFDSNSKAKQTVQVMEQNNVSFIIGAGDYSYGPAAATWFNQYIGPRFKGKMIGAIGNHDNNDYLAPFGMSKWVDAFKVAPNLAVVTINTEGSTKAAELEAATAKAKAMGVKHIAYVMHKAYVTSSDGHHPPSENKSGAIIDEIAKKYGVKLIVAGHNHVYEHFFCNGIHYVTSGAAGRKFYSTGCKACSPVKCTDNTNGFLKVSVGANLLCQFITHQNSIYDSFTIT